MQKKWIREGLGLHFGGVWRALGPLLGALGRLLAVFLVFESEFFASICPRWSPRGRKDRFWVDLGGFWEGFEGILKGFWPIFRWIVDKFGHTLEKRDRTRKELRQSL